MPGKQSACGHVASRAGTPGTDTLLPDCSKSGMPATNLVIQRCAGVLASYFKGKKEKLGVSTRKEGTTLP